MEPSSLDTIVDLLTSTLGVDKARAVVTQEVRTLGLGAALSAKDVVSVLRRLESAQGPEGLAAKLALLRYKRSLQGSISSGTFEALGQSAPPPRHSMAPPSAGVVPAEHLVSLFAKSLGDEKAAELIARGVTMLGLRRSQISRADAARLLDFIEGTGGLTGAVARFAKVRVTLMFGD